MIQCSLSSYNFSQFPLSRSITQVLPDPWKLQVHSCQPLQILVLLEASPGQQLGTLLKSCLKSKWIESGAQTYQRCITLNLTGVEMNWESTILIHIYYFAKFINIHVSNSIILKSFFCDFRQIFAGYCLQSFGNCKERCVFAQICGKPKHFHRPCFLDKKFLAFLLWKSAGCGSVSLFFLCIRQKSAKTKPVKLTSEGRLMSSFAFCSKSCAHSKIEKLWSLTATASCIFIPLSSNFRSSNFRPKRKTKWRGINLIRQFHIIQQAEMLPRLLVE